MPVAEVKEVTDTFHLTTRPENPVLKNFSIRKSSEADTLNWKSEPGIIILARADGEDLDWKTVVAMWPFIESVLLAVKEKGMSSTQRPGSAARRPVYDFFHASMTPEKFKEFFQRYPEQGWVGAKCPVVLDCKGCGKEDEKLSRCGKCEVVKYCSKECQKNDWDAHKRVCTKG